MSERYIDPKEYLDKHLEPGSPEDFDSSEFEGLSFVKDESIKQDEEGNLDYHDGDFQLQFHQEPVSGDEINEMRAKFLDKYFFDKIFASKDVKVLRDFKMKKGDSKIDIKELAPESIILVLSPREQEKEKINRCFGRKLLVVTGDLTKVETVSALLHEALHTDQEEDPSRENYNRRGLVSKREGASILHDERDAGAFTLKQLKPFLNPHEYRLLHDYIHKGGLSSYSEALKKRVAPDWAAKVSKYIGRLTAQKKLKKEENNFK